MKRGTIEHPKTLMLASMLKVRHLEAVGVLESLWHWSAKYAPRGDIGKFSNVLIASGMHWHGNADRLVECLRDARGDGAHGWLEDHSGYRLVIHDWSEHADDSIHKLLKRKGMKFWDGNEPCSRLDKFKDERDRSKTGRRPVNDRPVSDLPEPEPEPEPIPPNPQGGWRGEFLSELLKTGKMDGLTVEMLAMVLQRYPKAEMAEGWREIVMEVQGLAGKAGSVMGVLDRAISRREFRCLREGDKKERPAGGSEGGPVFTGLRGEE